MIQQWVVSRILDQSDESFQGTCDTLVGRRGKAECYFDTKVGSIIILHRQKLYADYLIRF